MGFRILLVLSVCLAAWSILSGVAGDTGKLPLKDKKEDANAAAPDKEKEKDLPAGKDKVSPGEAEQIAADEQILKSAKRPIKSDGPSLLAFFRKRTGSEATRAEIKDRVRKLGSPSYREREHAMIALITEYNVVALEMLREATQDTDLEIARRAEKCIQRILEDDVGPDVPPAAARLVAVRKPAGAVEVMLAFLPYADNDNVADETRNTLARLALEGGRPSPVLVEALKDKVPIRRAAAGEALCKAGAKEHMAAVRKLMTDPDAVVRLRVALALAQAKERAAVPVLIDLLPQLPLTQAWLAEDVLYRLADDHQPPAVSLGKDEDARKKCRDAWHAWWKQHGAKVDLARLSESPPLLGYTLVVLLDAGRVMELGNDNQPRWTIDGLVFPLDAQVLPGDRVLVAEYHAGRVTERNTKGEILWEKRITGPLVAQRLPSGNTFIATDSQLFEVDRGDKELYSVNLPGGERIMKAIKLPNGEIACLTADARILRLDTTGKILHSFNVSLGMRLFGGRIHMLANGRVLVPHNAENKVVEYDAQGKAVWEVSIEAPIAATRLPNGNTLVTTMIPQRGAVEFDRNGREVWSYKTSTRVTRALRR